VTVRVIVNVLGIPGAPGVTGEKEQVPVSCPKFVQTPENVTPAAFAVFRPSRFRVTLAEVLVNGIRRFAEGLASERVLATRVRLAVPVLDASATEVAVKVTMTGVAAELAG